MTNKHIEDMQDMAKEIMEMLLRKAEMRANNGYVNISFGNAEQIIAAYLLDVYNEGYDVAILDSTMGAL